MADKGQRSFEEQRRIVAEELWLNYFNQRVYESGLISEGTRNKMIHLISYRTSSGERTYSEREKKG